VASSYRAIDLTVFPFTPEMKSRLYEDDPVLREPMEHLGIWNKDFTPADLVADMDAAGVEKVLIPAQSGGSWEVPYEYIRDMTAAHPGRLYGLAGINPDDIVAGVRQLELGIRDYGFIGAHSYPHWFRRSPDDRSYYPFYAKCVELDVPIQIQVGLACQTDLRSVSHPTAIDSVAVDFPALRVVAIHTGYPWELEMVAVAWKHPNVYIGADCHPPKDWSSHLIDFIKGGGPFLFGKERGNGATKVIWGTNKPDQEFAESLAGVDELGFDDETKRRLIYQNVRNVFKVE
jgi:predicted TIM-barrel fold metal-dependent hydrolase